MDSSFAWQQLFEGWPASLPKKGLVVTNFQENIEFRDFMINDGILALERERPDSSGARKVMLSVSAISAVKVTDTNPFSDLEQLGFRKMR